MEVLFQRWINEQLASVALVAFIFLLVLSLYRRREGLRHYFRRAFVAEAAYILLAVYLVRSGVQPIVAIPIAVLCGIAAEHLIVKPRSRHIPAAERRKVIAHYQRKTGQKYDRRKDEFDHVIPFSKWGSSTADNLRVRPRAVNRSKGKKSRWWDLLG